MAFESNWNYVIIQVYLFLRLVLEKQKRTIEDEAKNKWKQWSIDPKNKSYIYIYQKLKSISDSLSKGLLAE